MAMPNPGPAPVWPDPNGSPDFITPASRTVVTINFVTNSVTQSRKRMKWPLTNYTKIIGDRNFVEVKTDETIPVEVIAGPPHFSMPPPVVEPGKKYVFIEGNTNGWKLRSRFRSAAKKRQPQGQGLPG